MAGDLWLEVATGDGIITVRVHGDVDLSTKERLGEALLRLAKDPTDLVLDARGMTFIDSIGLSMLHEIHRLCGDVGGTLTIQAPSGPVSQLLEMSGLATELHVIQ